MISRSGKPLHPAKLELYSFPPIIKVLYVFLSIPLDSVCNSPLSSAYCSTTCGISRGNQIVDFQQQQSHADHYSI